MKITAVKTTAVKVIARVHRYSNNHPLASSCQPPPICTLVGDRPFPWWQQLRACILMTTGAQVRAHENNRLTAASKRQPPTNFLLKATAPLHFIKTTAGLPSRNAIGRLHSHETYGPSLPNTRNTENAPHKLGHCNWSSAVLTLQTFLRNYGIASVFPKLQP